MLGATVGASADRQEVPRRRASTKALSQTVVTTMPTHAPFGSCAAVQHPAEDEQEKSARRSSRMRAPRTEKRETQEQPTRSSDVRMIPV